MAMRYTQVVFCSILLLLRHFVVDAKKQKPNFVVLFVDDMGSNQVDFDMPELTSNTGHDHRIPTPNLKKLAKQSLVFDSFYAGFQSCSPSRGVMMTGRLATRLGLGIPCYHYAPDIWTESVGLDVVFRADAVGGLPLTETTTAEALKPLGYATGMIGKWQLGLQKEQFPPQRGFDWYYGLPLSWDQGTSFWSPAHPSPTDRVPLALYSNNTVVEQPVNLARISYKYLSRARTFIETQAASQTPFYLYYAFNKVHNPFLSASEFCGSSVDGEIGDMVAEVDWVVGRILDILQRAGVSDNTLVIFTSDNGAALNFDPDGNLPYRSGKGSTHEGGSRVPGLAYWPGKVIPGISKEIAGVVDIHPTLVSLAGGKLPTDRIFDGKDMSPLLFGEKDAKGRQCHFYSRFGSAPDADRQLFAVRCGEFKARWSVWDGVFNQYGRQFRPPQLYNLTAAPDEQARMKVDDVYHKVMKDIYRARGEYLMTLDPTVTNQHGRGFDHSLLPCARVNSTPYNCSYTSANWYPKQYCENPKCHSNYFSRNITALCKRTAMFAGVGS